MGIKKDINLVGDDYQWLSSMFYFGYLFWEYPTSRLLQRLPLAKYSAFCVIAWGTTLALFATVSNFGGAVAIRFFLGVFESAVTPGFALFTSQWYTKAEQGKRVGFWFSFNGWGQIFGGLVSYGIARGTAIHGSAIEPWKIVFLVNGLLTAVLGCVFLYVMPDNQLNARWLKKSDRILAVERVRVNQQGIGNKHFKMYQLKETLLDPITWAFVFYALVADIPNGGISNFFSQLVSTYFRPSQIQHLLTNSSTDRLIWLHSRSIAPLRYPRRRRRSRLSRRLRLPRRPLQEPHINLHGWSLNRAHRNHPHRRVAVEQQRRPPSGVLSDASVAHALRCHPELDFDECGRIHEEDDYCRVVFDWVLCGEYYWWVSCSGLFSISLHFNRSPTQPHIKLLSLIHTQ
jgi:hypothetical protein